MSEERRRYFRITDMIGIAYEVMSADGQDGQHDTLGQQGQIANLLDDIEAIDTEILLELEHLAGANPAVTRLIRLFNQKLERVINHVLVDNQLVTRLAQRLKEVSISACGMAFPSEDAAEVGTTLHMELTLYPSKETLQTQARVVACDSGADHGSFYWRVDFFNMRKDHQEVLIQHIVRAQSRQLKNKVKI